MKRAALILLLLGVGFVVTLLYAHYPDLADSRVFKS